MTPTTHKQGMESPIRALRWLLRKDKGFGPADMTNDTKGRNAMGLTPLHHPLAAYLGREFTPAGTSILLQATDTTDRKIAAARFEPVANGATRRPAVEERAR